MKIKNIASTVKFYENSTKFIQKITEMTWTTIKIQYLNPLTTDVLPIIQESVNWFEFDWFPYGGNIGR